MGKLRATHLNDLCGMSVMMVFMEWESVDDKLGNVQDPFRVRLREYLRDHVSS